MKFFWIKDRLVLVYLRLSKSGSLSYDSVTQKMRHKENTDQNFLLKKIRSSRPEVFLGIGFLKICSKFTGGHPCRKQSNFIEITLRHRCSRVRLLHVFRTSFSKNTSGWLLLKDTKKIHCVKSVRLWNTNTFYAVIKRFFEEELLLLFYGGLYVTCIYNLL